MSLQGMWNILTDNHNDGDDGGDQLRRATTPSSTGQMELDPLRAEPSLPIPLILRCSVTQLQPTRQPTNQPDLSLIQTNSWWKLFLGDGTNLSGGFGFKSRGQSFLPPIPVYHPGVILWRSGRNRGKISFTQEPLCQPLKSRAVRGKSLHPG